MLSHPKQGLSLEALVSEQPELQDPIQAVRLSMAQLY